MLLNGAADFPSWDDLDLTSDALGKIGPEVNVAAVDYDITPEIKDIKRFSVARLEPGQCLFVPEGWIHQINILGGDHSMEIRSDMVRVFYNAIRRL